MTDFQTWTIDWLRIENKPWTTQELWDHIEAMRRLKCDVRGFPGSKGACE